MVSGCQGIRHDNVRILSEKGFCSRMQFSEPIRNEAGTQHDGHMAVMWLDWKRVSKPMAAPPAPSILPRYLFQLGRSVVLKCSSSSNTTKPPPRRSVALRRTGAPTKSPDLCSFKKMLLLPDYQRSLRVAPGVGRIMPSLQSLSSTSILHIDRADGAPHAGWIAAGIYVDTVLYMYIRLTGVKLIIIPSFESGRTEAIQILESLTSC